MTEIPAEPDDQADPVAAFSGEPLAEREHAAVVAEVEDDRVVQDPVGLELGQPLGHVGVHCVHQVVVVGVVGADGGGVGKEGGHSDGGWVGGTVDGAEHL